MVVRVPAADGVLVVLVDEQPLLAVALTASPDERQTTPELLSVDVDVDTSDFSIPVGEPGQVSVTVECRLDLSDLSVPGVPGSRVNSSAFRGRSPTHRSRSPLAGSARLGAGP